MITKTQYEILINCKDSPQPFDINFDSELSFLVSNQYLIIEEIQTKNGWKSYYRTSKNIGLLAIQEYEDRVNGIEKENRAMQIAEEQKQIAEESNRIAKEANIKSKRANTISIWSIVISGVFSLITVVASVLIAIFIKK